MAKACRLWGGNEALLQACRAVVDAEADDALDPTMVIVRAVWARLKATYGWRLVR